MIYLDNAATTKNKPFSVMVKTLFNEVKYSSNPGRGGHTPSVEAGKQVFETRLIANRFFNGYGTSNVIFTSGCSESLNLIILGLFNKDTKVKPNIITSCLEHNSVLRPLKFLEKNGKITLTVINNYVIDSFDIKNAIEENTKAVIITARSNVIGNSPDLKQIGEVCRQHNLIFIVDAAQAAGHSKIDMKQCNISALCVPSHKGLFGLMGGGMLLINDKIKNESLITPLKYGGTGTNSIELIQPAELPERYESGTLPLPVILSMKNGMLYCEKNLDKIKVKEKELTTFLLLELSKIKGIKIYGANQAGVISFNYKNIDSSILSEKLNKHGICVRSGLHCAPLIHKFFKTVEQGMTRVSVSYLSTKNELKKFISVLKLILGTF